MLATEFKYYRANYRRLQEKYSNKYIVIKGKKVMGIYNSHSEAYSETIQNEVLGTFLIQKILYNKDYFKEKRNRFSLLFMRGIRRLRF